MVKEDNFEVDQSARRQGSFGYVAFGLWHMGARSPWPKFMGSGLSIFTLLSQGACSPCPNQGGLAALARTTIA